MKRQAIINILFLLFIFIYQLFGDYNNIAWGLVFYMILYGYLFMVNLELLKNTLFFIYRFIFILSLIYFGFSALTMILCLVVPSLFPVFVSNTNLYLSGTLLILVMLIILYMVSNPLVIKFYFFIQEKSELIEKKWSIFSIFIKKLTYKIFGR